MIDFSIVKRAIDRADVCGLLACHAPSDEYDCESEEIARIICEHDSAKRISEICANVFSRTFSENIASYKVSISRHRYQGDVDYDNKKRAAQ